jgi:hypothetical protein
MDFVGCMGGVASLEKKSWRPVGYDAHTTAGKESSLIRDITIQE